MSTATLGAWPTDWYYDPNRPSWVPYQIDTPTESAVRWGVYPKEYLKPMPAPKPLPLPVAPQTEDDVRNWNPDKAAREQIDAFEVWKPSALDDAYEISVEAQNKRGQQETAIWIAISIVGVASVLALFRN